MFILLLEMIMVSKKILRLCYRCGTEDYCRGEYDDNGDWTGKWICRYCYDRYSPRSTHTIMRSITNIRNGYLSVSSKHGKAIIDQAVVSKVLNIDDLNIKMDKFTWYIDMENSEDGKIDVKGATILYGDYHFQTERNIESDTYICIGYDKKRKNIDDVWKIPNEGRICNITSIKTVKNPSKTSIYNKFKIGDIEIYNDTYHNLLSYLGNRKYIGIDDIKKWRTL